MRSIFDKSPNNLNLLTRELKKDEWIGVDLDGTLAYYESGYFDIDKIGEPIPKMLEIVKFWLANNYTVKIFTARVTDDGIKDTNKIKELIQNWCLEHIGVKLQITNIKDYKMIELWDDKAVSVKLNTGEYVSNNF